MKRKLVLICALAALTASGAMASAFRAADLVYLPVAGKVEGAAGSFFQTDVWISNVSNTRANVYVAFAPGNNDNSGAPAAAVQLTPILEPGERREIRDIMGTLFPTFGNTAGQMLFFAYREGVESAICEDAPQDCRQITVQARIYTQTAGGGPTFGQLIPGIAWYNFVSPRAAHVNLDQVFITGIRQFGSAGVSGFRTNIGLVNASSFEPATLRVRLFGGNGQEIGVAERTLQPLGWIQENVAQLFPGFSGEFAWVTVEQVDTGAQDLAFFAYGSLLDNQSNDQTYLEAQFTEPLDDVAIGCIYGAKPPRRLARRE